MLIKEKAISVSSDYLWFSRVKNMCTKSNGDGDFCEININDKNGGKI